MTERLNQLLHAEADQLDIPPVAADAALTRGRGIRRRRTFAMAGATVAVLAVIGGTALVATGGDEDDRATEPADSPAANVPAFAFQSKFTSATRLRPCRTPCTRCTTPPQGVLVRSNPNDGASDGSGPESLTLVRYDGSTVDLGTIPEGVGPATDPEEPVYALAEARDGGFVAVIRDATTGETVSEVPLPDLPPSYWDVPPLALDGDTLYVGYESEAVAVDLATGARRGVEGIRAGSRTCRVAGPSPSRAPPSPCSTPQPASWCAASKWATTPGEHSRRTVAIWPSRRSTTRPSRRTFSVYDVGTGELVDLGQLAGAQGLGWTAAGDAFAIDRGVLTTCDLGSGDCTKRDVDVPSDAFVKLGGRVYES